MKLHQYYLLLCHYFLPWLWGTAFARDGLVVLFSAQAKHTKCNFNSEGNWPWCKLKRYRRVQSHFPWSTALKGNEGERSENQQSGIIILCLIANRMESSATTMKNGSLPTLTVRGRIWVNFCPAKGMTPLPEDHHFMLSLMSFSKASMTWLYFIKKVNLCLAWV